VGTFAGVLSTMEGILQQLLAARVTSSRLLTLLGRALEGFGRFLAIEPQAFPAVVEKVRVHQSRSVTRLRALFFLPF
jgi:hypothetical protein